MTLNERDRLLELLTELRLRGMVGALEPELERAKQTGSATELLYRLLLEENRYRRERSLAYRLDQAKLPWPWTLETFPFHSQEYGHEDELIRVWQQLANTFSSLRSRPCRSVAMN